MVSMKATFKKRTCTKYLNTTKTNTLSCQEEERISMTSSISMEQQQGKGVMAPSNYVNNS